MNRRAWLVSLAALFGIRWRTELPRDETFVALRRLGFNDVDAHCVAAKIRQTARDVATFRYHHHVRFTEHRRVL